MLPRFGCLALCAFAIFGQTTAAPTEFEAAAIKPAASPVYAGRDLGMRHGGPGTSDPGQITWNAVSLKGLMMVAYNLKSYQVSGPPWLATTGVDIVAKVPRGTTREQLPALWQNLLLERLHLKSHLETREIAVYELTVARGGVKIEEVHVDPNLPASGMPQPGADGCSVFPGGRPVTSLSSSRGLSRMCAGAATLDTAMSMLARELDRPVLNATGLNGTYSFKLEFAPLTPSSGSAEPAPDLFSAVQQQLGLRLVPKNVPMEVRVVDSVDRTPPVN